MPAVCVPRLTPHVRGRLQESFIEREIKRIQLVCGEHGHVIGAVSGGVDSTVAAALLGRAIGPRYVSLNTQ